MSDHIVDKQRLDEIMSEPLEEGPIAYEELCEVVEPDIAAMLIARESTIDIVVYLDLISKNVSHSRAWEVMIRSAP